MLSLRLDGLSESVTRGTDFAELLLQIEIFCRDGFGLSRSAPMFPASLWVLPHRSSRLCYSSRLTLAISSHSRPLESHLRFVWSCRERSCARQSLEKSALFRHLRRSMCSRRSRTINKKTRLSGAGAIRYTAPFVHMAPGPCARKRCPNAWFIRTKPVVAMGKHRCVCTWF